MTNRHLIEKVGKRIPGRSKGLCQPQRQEGLWHEGSGSWFWLFGLVWFYMTRGKVAAAGERAGRVQVVMC